MKPASPQTKKYLGNLNNRVLMRAVGVIQSKPDSHDLDRYEILKINRIELKKPSLTQTKRSLM